MESVFVIWSCPGEMCQSLTLVIRAYAQVGLQIVTFLAPVSNLRREREAISVYHINTIDIR